jgi:GTP-binding protein
MKGSAFKDRAKVYISSGNGGNGMATFRREKYVPRGGPDGGDGGRGGHVFLLADRQVDSLLPLTYTPHQRAEHGGHGARQRCHGKNGADLTIRVPCGTTVRDLESDVMLGEVVEDGEQMQVAVGGKGGLGNCHFVSSTHQAPRECTPGEPGENKTLMLELKIVADAGLVGYPNAGKSTLLSRLSHAHPKIAAYPFTTLNPIIGTVEFDDFASLHLADIPGLIDGAHEGVGLGHDFLRHIERTKFLVFVIDMAAIDGRDPGQDYVNLREELRLYRPELDARPYLVVANKMDLPQSWDNFRDFQKATGEEAIPISAAENEGVEQVKRRLYEALIDTDAASPLLRRDKK